MPNIAMSLKTGRKVLIGCLDWGLGHATRSSAIIRMLKSRGYEPVIASSGLPLLWLEKMFPELETIALYNPRIRYSVHPRYFLFRIGLQLPLLMFSVYKDKKKVRSLLRLRPDIVAIFSDHRLGFYSANRPSVMIAHQLNLPIPLPKLLAWPLQKIYSKMLSRFNTLWIPDLPGGDGLSGKLSRPFEHHDMHFVGPLSSFLGSVTGSGFHVLILLSGPEPQRSILEKICLSLAPDSAIQVVLVRGTTLPCLYPIPEKWECFDFLYGSALEELMKNARLVICRSGYSTLMDLYRLGLPALFVPTPGQPEQEYLSILHAAGGSWMSVSQDALSTEKVNEALAVLKPFASVSYEQLLFGAFNKLEESLNFGVHGC